MVLKLLLLIALVKLLMQSNSPSLCAGIYALASLVICHLSGGSLRVCVVLTAAAFILSFIYFWLLNYFEDNNLIWWPIAIIGCVITLF